MYLTRKLNSLLEVLTMNYLLSSIVTLGGFFDNGSAQN